MLCRCCNFNVSDGKSTCPVCGFPLLGDTGSETQRFIEAYRKGKLAGISVAIKTYCYEIAEDGDLRVASEEYIKVADAVELEKGNIFWLDREFERLESDSSITVEISIAGDGKEKRSSLELKPGKVIGHSSVGILMGDGFSIQLAVGEKNDHLLTDSVSLV